MAKKKTTARARKPTTNKTTVRKTSVSRVKTASPIIGKTRNLHKLNLVLQLMLAGMVVFMMNPLYHVLSLSHVTNDALLSVNETVFVPAEKVLFDFDLRWLLLAMIAASAIYSLLLLSRWRTSYEKAQTGRIYMWRWVFFAVTASIMVSVAAVLSGIEDLFTLKMAGWLMIFAMGLAWLSEVQHEKAGRPTGAPFWLALLSGLAAMSAAIGSLVGTTLFGMVRFPWYVYAVNAVVLLSFLFVLLNLRLVNRRAGQSNDYPFAERNYVLIFMLSQLVITAVAIAGLSA